MLQRYQDHAVLNKTEGWDDAKEWERLRELKPSPCLKGTNPVDRVPRRMVDLWTSLARRMPNLETLVWNAWGDGQEPSGSLRWKVVRGEGGEVSLVDDGTRFKELKKSCTGSEETLGDIIDGHDVL